MDREEAETHLCSTNRQRAAVQLPYRSLWLDESHTLAQVELVLADALGCTSDAAPLDALALAEAAAYKLRELGAVVGATKHRRPTRQPRQRQYA